jgi:transketolase
MENGTPLPSTSIQRLCLLHAYEALGKTLCDLADELPQLAVVVADYGRRLFLDRLRKDHPEDYVQVGIAEQNQVSVAAALALEGFCAFVPSYAAFITGRAFDQVRICMGSMKAPVILIGLSAGYDSGTLGATHMATEDAALMRTVPGVLVLSPADNAELVVMLRQLAAHPQPAYIRITGASEQSCLHVKGLPQKAMRPETLRSGHDVTIFATGKICKEALHAADILQTEAISASLTEVPCLNPFDAEAARKATAKARLIVSVEEHSVRGGLGSALREALSTAPSAPPLLTLGTPLVPPSADTRPALLHHVALDAQGIAASIEAFLGSPVA